MPNKLSQFWQELKRRRVIKVIAMYAGAAYILIELANNVVEPLNLPDWTPRLVILIVLIGFPVAAILSWIFDINPEGIKKTESIEEIAETEPLPPVGKRRLKVSDVIIAVLFVTVCILIYPKIFKSDKFKDIRDEDGRISIAVMPFQNLTNDTLLDVWEKGIQNELITNLSNSKELAVRRYQTVYDMLEGRSQENYASISTTSAGEISGSMNAYTFIQGSLKESGKIIRLSAQLINSKTTEIYRTFQVEGESVEDIFSYTDSLSNLVKNYLELQVLEEGADYYAKMHSTSSAQAFRYYIQSLDVFIASKWYEAIELLNKVIEIDSGFVGALNLLSCSYINTRQIDRAKSTLKNTSYLISNASLYDQLWYQYHKSTVDKNPQGQIEATKRLTEEYPLDKHTWYDLGLSYRRIQQYDKAANIYEKALEINERLNVEWKWLGIYVSAGICYHNLGNHHREQEIYKQGLDVLPENPSIIFHQAVCAASQGDTKIANDYLAKYRSISEVEGIEEYWINYNVGMIHTEAEQYDKAIKIFRSLIRSDPQEPQSKIVLGSILVENESDIDEGMRLIDEALKINPGNPTYLYTKGVRLYEQGKLEKALELLNKSWDLRPFYDHDHFHKIQEVEQALASQNQQ